MKKFKKIASLLLALVMVCAMSVTALAADIVVENTTTGKTYTAYKIFDATSSGNAVSYTIESTSAWYSTVSDATSVFTLTQAGQDSTTYYVTVNDDVDDANVIAVFASVPAGATVAASGTGNGGSLTLSNVDAGYYYINTTNGSAVTITTTTTGTVTVVDKNQTPGGDLNKTVSDTEAQIGDTVTYTITSNVPAYDGTTKIENYTFTDTLSEGLTAPEASDVTVEILKLDNTNGTVTINENKYTVVKTLTSSVKVSGQVITVSYNPTTIENYPADAVIKITYTATVNTSAAYANGNSVTQTWTEDSTGKTDTETVYTYGFNLQKVDGSDNTTQLFGAKFKLYTSQTGGEALKFSYNANTNTYTVDPAGSVTEIEAGDATIFGLDSDVTYYLEETQAPAGYNVLKDRVAVTVSTTGTSESDGVVTISQTVQVENNAGSSLPSTGGIGTTIFYVVGTIMVLGAVVVLITRKRMSAQ